MIHALLDFLRTLTTPDRLDPSALHGAVRMAGLRHPDCHRFRRNGLACRVCFARRFVALHHRRSGRRGAIESHRHDRVADRRLPGWRLVRIPARPARRARPSSTGRIPASSSRNTCSAPTRFTTSTAARPSSMPSSCRSSAPSRHSSRAWRTCAIAVSFRFRYFRRHRLGDLHDCAGYPARQDSRWCSAISKSSFCW